MHGSDGFKRNAWRRVAWGLAAGAWVAGLAGIFAVAKFQPAEAKPSYGSSCGQCHVSSTGGKLKASAGGAKQTKSKSSPGAAAAAPAAQASEGRALDYVPWTLHDPYYSHFRYNPDDYRD